MTKRKTHEDQNVQDLIRANAKKAGAGADVDFRSIGMHARFEYLYGSKDKTNAVSSAADPAWVKMLDDIGYMQVAEFVAQGNLPLEYAMQNSIPHMAFTAWWASCPASLAALAREANAQMCMLKSELSVTGAPPDESTARMAVELSKHFAERARAVNPGSWVPNIKKQDTTPQIVMNISGAINGLEHLTGAQPIKQIHDVDTPVVRMPSKYVTPTVSTKHLQKVIDV